MAFSRATIALCVLVALVCSRPTVAQDHLLERGRYLVETVAFCGVCHNSRGPNGQMIAGMELAGGRVMALNEMRTVLSNIPPGDIRAVVPNITSDPETGIGRWTDTQIATAIREGATTGRVEYRPPDADRTLSWSLGPRPHGDCHLPANRSAETKRGHATLELSVSHSHLLRHFPFHTLHGATDTDQRSHLQDAVPGVV